MFKALLSKKHPGRPAQAMVEFALVALTFLMLLVMIIEVARLLQAYVTIQHAARQAARYGVTGKFETKYSDNPIAGWDEERHTADPLRSIRPCWPLFSVVNYDGAFPHATPRTPTGDFTSILHQPYRDVRTCSVEEKAIRSMSGLIMNPNAGAYEPDYYDIIVSGIADDIDPTEGTFERHGTTDPDLDIEEREYADYYIPTDTVQELNEEGELESRLLSEVKQGTSRGYAGNPGTKVQVQIEYRMRIITPLLSNIVRSVRLTALSVMTVETFGSTSLQRDSVPVPPNPEALDFSGDIEPPDLSGYGLTCIPTSQAAGGLIACSWNIANNSESVTFSASRGAVYRIYGNTSSVTPDLPIVSGGSWLQLAEGPINRDIPVGGDPTSIHFEKSFTVTNPGLYYIYVWLDAGENATGDGTVEEVNLNEKYSSRDRITNNVLLPPAGPISVTQNVDIAPEEPDAPLVAVDKPVPSIGARLTYNIKVTNHGTSPAANVKLTMTWDDGLSCVSSPCDDERTLGIIEGGDFKVAEFRNALEVVSGAQGDVKNAYFTATTNTTQNPNVYLDMLPVPVTIDGVLLTASKSVAPLEVEYSTSAASNVTYTITITNGSDNAASNVRVVDRLPLGLEYRGPGSFRVTPSSGSEDCSGTTEVTCTGISVAARGLTRLEIDVRVLAGTGPGQVENHATVTAPASPEAKTPINYLMIRGADIGVTKEASARAVTEGQRFTYTIRATNHGPSAAQSVKIREEIPAGLSYVSADDSAYSPVSGVWDVGSLGVSESKRLQITVSVNPGSAGSSIRNTAELMEGSTPPNPTTGGEPDSDEVEVQVSGANANLTLKKDILSSTGTVLSPPVTVMTGTTLSYRLTLTNAGPDDATDAVVDDSRLAELFYGTGPDGSVLDYVSDTTTPGSTLFDETTGQWTGISLAPGEQATATITFIAVGKPGSITTVRNYASASSSVPDTDGADVNTDFQINWPAPIFINAGGSGCAEVLWGNEDATLGNRNFTWTVNGAANNWSLEGGQAGAVSLSEYYFVDQNDVDLSVPYGQNLFGCHTKTTRLYSSGGFTYTFNSIAPGNWRLYLAFAEWATEAQTYRLLDVSANGTGVGVQILDDFDIVAAITAVVTGGNRHLRVEDVYDVHYIILPFDIRVGPQGSLSLRFTAPGGQDNAIVNGLGIEYIGQ